VKDYPYKAQQRRLVKTGRKPKRILIHVHKEFLEEFDKETRGKYASRNEAIRAGMTIVLETLKKRHTAKDQYRSSR